MSQEQEDSREEDGRKSDSDEGKDESKSGNEGKDKGKDSKKDDKNQKHSKLPLIIGAIVIVIVIIGGVIYWLATMNEVVTDDAYTDGQAISIAANVSGYATALYISDNTYVHAGELLLTIDPRADQAAVQQAQANLALAQSQLESAGVSLVETKVQAPAQLQQAQAQLMQAQAQLFQTRRNYEREASVDRRAQPATDLDQATEQLRAAEGSVKQAEAQVATASLIPEKIKSAQETAQQRQAQVLQAQANLAQSMVELSYNEIHAPQDGNITMRNVELGTYIQTGQQVFYIVTRHIWITANFKETQLARMRPGDRVDISVDAYPSLKLRGYVQSIQLGSGARFSAFPAENATGNFVKIVRRVPVKIIIDRGLPAGQGLPLGISVEPTVYVK